MATSTCPGEIAFLRSTVQALRIMVGVVFAATVFDNLHHDNYDPLGYRRLINGYLERGNQPSFQRSIMRVVRDHAAVAGPLQEVTEIAIAVALLAGIAVPLFSLIASLLLAGLGLSELAVGWTWELWPLVLMACLVVFASLPAVHSRGLRALVGERPDAGGILDPLRLSGRLALAAAIGGVVLYILHQNRQPAASTTLAALSVGLLLSANVVLDQLAAQRKQNA